MYSLVSSRGLCMRLPVTWGNACTCDIKVSAFLHPLGPTGYSVSPILHFTFKSYFIISTLWKKSSSKHILQIFFQKRQPHADLQCSVNPTEPEHSFNHKNRARFSSAQHIKDIRGSSVQKCDELFATCSLPVFILEVMRDRSMRRGGRIGVDVFVVLVFFLSKGLLILERGAKIPEKN